MGIEQQLSQLESENLSKEGASDLTRNKIVKPPANSSIGEHYQVMINTGNTDLDPREQNGHNNDLRFPRIEQPKAKKPLSSDKHIRQVLRLYLEKTYPHLSKKARKEAFDYFSNNPAFMLLLSTWSEIDEAALVDDPSWKPWRDLAFPQHK